MRKRIGDGPYRLTVLLDALEADILAAPADELRDALCETGRASCGACKEVRSLLDEALLASDETAIGAAPTVAAPWNDLVRH